MCKKCKIYKSIKYLFHFFCSSRFTDSKRYEASFDRCFDLAGERRAGEICNACVLLVKRFMKLPSGTLRNWNHVVDARSGPGIKSLVSHLIRGIAADISLFEHDI